MAAPSTGLIFAAALPKRVGSGRSWVFDGSGLRHVIHPVLIRLDPVSCVSCTPHTARDEAALLYRHVYKQEDITTQSRLVPHAVFTDPEVASFGLSETQARQTHGDQIGIGVERFRGVAKARAIDETAGFIKITTGPDRRIVGATIVGPDAGNLIHELVVAATAGITIDQVSQAIHIHPTLAEGVNAAAGGVHRPTSDDQ